MKKIYVCPLIGTGIPEEDEYRPYIANYPVGWSFYREFMEGDAECVVVVNTTEAMHEKLLADPLVDLWQPS